MLFFRFRPNKTMSLKWDLCNGGKNSKKRTMFLLACNADGPDKLPSLVTEKNASPCCFITVRKLPTKYVAKRREWVIQDIFSDNLWALDATMSSINRKILFFIDLCADHPQGKNYLKNVKAVFFPSYCTSMLQSYNWYQVIQTLFP